MHIQLLYSTSSVCFCKSPPSINWLIKLLKIQTLPISLVCFQTICSMYVFLTSFVTWASVPLFTLFLCLQCHFSILSVPSAHVPFSVSFLTLFSCSIGYPFFVLPFYSVSHFVSPCNSLMYSLSKPTWWSHKNYIYMEGDRNRAGERDRNILFYLK